MNLINCIHNLESLKNLYLAQHCNDVETPQPGSLKPICPTSWLSRLFGVKSVLQNCSYVLDALKQWFSNFLRPRHTLLPFQISRHTWTRVQISFAPALSFPYFLYPMHYSAVMKVLRPIRVSVFCLRSWSWSRNDLVSVSYFLNWSRDRTFFDIFII